MVGIMVRTWVFLLLGSASVTSSALAGPTTLSFRDCVDLLDRANPELLAARAALRAQEETWKGSYAAFFPSVEASLGMSRSDPAGIPDPRYTSGVNVSYNLFSGLRDRGRNRQAGANLEVARANLDSVRAKVSANLRQVFAQYLFARENITLTAAIHERRIQNERLVRAQYELGRENQGSYLFSKTLMELAEYENRVARDQLVIASQNLAHVVGVDALDFEASGEIPLSEPPETARAEDLLPVTPAHRIQLGKIKLAESTSEVALSGFSPSLDLSGSVRNTASHLSFDENRQWTLGLALTIPLFSGLSTLRDYRSALESITSAESNRTVVDFETLTSLRQSLFSFRQSIHKLRVDLHILEAATIRATIARKRYHTGLLMFEQWDIIESDLINRQKTALASRRDRAIAEANYRQTLGIGDHP